MDMKYVLIGLLFLFILVVWLYVDYTLGRKKHVAESDRKKYPVHSGRLALFVHGTELFEDLFREIERAKHHVHVLFYIARNDQISREFYSLLMKKASEGVEVRLLLDWLGSRKLSKEIIAELKKAKVHFSFCHVPKLPYLFYTANVRNHRKITVIDGKIGYVGGFNVGKEYIDQDPKLTPWRDYHLKLQGEVVHDLQYQFFHDWKKATGIMIENGPAYFPKMEQGKTAIQVITSEGAFIEDIFSKEIKNAKKSIMIGSPYFIPSKRLFFDLLAAARRGVKITILVPKITDHMLVQEASYWYFRRLIKAGAEVRQYVNGFYHAKILVFDKELCVIGTTNFDQRSLFLNYEINCFISDKLTIKEFMAIVNNDLNASKKLSLADLRHVGMLTKFKEAVARPMARFL
jgi:cardiolipin synthase